MLGRSFGWMCSKGYGETGASGMFRVAARCLLRRKLDNMCKGKHTVCVNVFYASSMLMNPHTSNSTGTFAVHQTLTYNTCPCRRHPDSADGKAWLVGMGERGRRHRS